MKEAVDKRKNQTEDKIVDNKQAFTAPKKKKIEKHWLLNWGENERTSLLLP